MIRPRSCIAMLFRGHFDFYGAYAFIVSFSFFFFVDFRFFFCKLPFFSIFYFLYIYACCCISAASSK